MAENKIEVRLLTPEIPSVISPYKYNGEADMVILRAGTGDRGFLPGHEPCSVVLDAGIMRIFGAAEQELKLAVLGGVAQFEDDILTIVTDTAHWPEDIDRTRAVARRDELISQIERETEKTDYNSLNRLRKKLRDAEVLVAVSALPPSGVTHEK